MGLSKNALSSHRWFEGLAMNGTAPWWFDRLTMMGLGTTLQSTCTAVVGNLSEFKGHWGGKGGGGLGLQRSVTVRWPRGPVSGGAGHWFGCLSPSVPLFTVLRPVPAAEDVPVGSAVRNKLWARDLPRPALAEASTNGRELMSGLAMEDSRRQLQGDSDRLR